jgi:hypothetical protein
MSIAALQEVPIPQAAATQNIYLTPLVSNRPQVTEGYVYVRTSGIFTGPDAHFDLSGPHAEMTFDDIEGYID